ncbi:MAG TPA: 2-oxoglutarate dehydrogenase complex dihydrolipoyllysine-residue succinyltransferase, partial [Gemmatales bacterium]|nr:2-oxoglutarate dehydrogenase complex dihydrolipoyllysine-residue succinyltransferase [Gemmatales bacterium]
SVTEALVAKWLKADGDYVQADENIVELETDKAVQEVASTRAGRLKIVTQEGNKVPIGTVQATIDDTAVPEKSNAANPAATPAVAQKPTTSSVTSQVPSSTKIEPILSPAARVHAELKGIDPASITGTGRDGRIIKEDVLKATTKPVSTGQIINVTSQVPMTASATPAGGLRETRQKMSMIRTRIAQRLVESKQNTAQLTTFNEVDMSGIMALRNKFKDKFKEKYGIGLGFMSFFVKAVIEGLKAFPLVNARIDGEEIVLQHYYDIGIAVSTERGLMVPIIRNCETLSFAQIEKQIGEMAVKARDGKIAVSDLQGGTFTITNGGVFGSLFATPILNPPQSGILGMHGIKDRPVVVDGQIVIRPMMYLAFTYDHRIIDGKESVQFLVRVKECLEDPQRLMLEV